MKNKLPSERRITTHTMHTVDLRVPKKYWLEHLRVTGKLTEQVQQKGDK